MAPSPRVSRRQVLLAGAGGLLLSACGKGPTTSAAPKGFTLVNAFTPAQPVGVPVRLPLALAGSDGSFDVDLPPSVRVHLARPDGTTTASSTIARHDEGLPRGYFPLQTTLDVAGRWTIVVTAGTITVRSTVDAQPASALPSVPGPGDPLPKIPTPTLSDHRGVEPICTHDPVCPFHTRSLDEVIGGHEPIALIVSTPAFCQVAICGPVLDLLIKRQARLRDKGIAVIHAEVYVDDQAEKTTPTVDALGLSYEPALWLAAPDGTVNQRLDNIFDGRELDAALAMLVP